METTLERGGPKGGRPVDWTAPFSIAIVLVLAALVLLPMFWLAVTSLRDDAGRFTLEHYRHLVLDPTFIRPLVTTLWTSAAVGVSCVVAAAPMSWLVSRTDLPGKRLLRVLILASFVTPPSPGCCWAAPMLDSSTSGITRFSD
jgi:iron(III) transport system permease protein